MSRPTLRLTISLLGILSLFADSRMALANNDPVAAVRSALDELDQFVGNGDNGNSWRQFLHSEELRRELSAASGANRDKLREILALYAGQENGLELSQFMKVRTALQDWLAQPVEIAKSSPSGGPSNKVQLVSAQAPETAVSVGTPPVNLVKSAAQYSAEAELMGFDRWVAGDKAWREYIEKSGLDEILKSGKSDEAARKFVESIRDKLRKDEEGLESIPAARLETALSKYLRSFGGEIAKPATGAPNFFVHTTAAVAGVGANQSIDRTEPIVDDILGTHIVGSGRTIGQTQMRFSPNLQKATFDMVLTAKNYSNTTGYHDPVTIFSTGVTNLCGQKQSQMDADGLVGFKACAQADAHTNVNGLCVNRKHFHRIIERAAWKQIGQNHAEAESIASQHAAQRLQARMEKDGNERIAKSNSQYRNEFKAKLEARDAFPPLLNFATPTSDLLTIVAREAADDQIGAPGEPPALKDPGSLSVRIHETMLNNFLAKRMAGREVTANMPKETSPQTANESDETFNDRKQIAKRRYDTFSQKQTQREKDKLRMQTIFITEKPEKTGAPTPTKSDPAGGEGTLKAERQLEYIYHPARPVEMKFLGDDVRATFNLKTVRLDGQSRGEWQVVAVYHMSLEGNELVLKLKNANAKENLDPTQEGQKKLLRDIEEVEANKKGNEKNEADNQAAPEGAAGGAAAMSQNLGVFIVPPEPAGTNLEKRITGNSIRTSFYKQLKPEYRLRYVALPGNWINAGQMKVQDFFCKEGWLGLGLQQNGLSVEPEIVAKRNELK